MWWWPQTPKEDPKHPEDGVGICQDAVLHQVQFRFRFRQKGTEPNFSNTRSGPVAVFFQSWDWTSKHYLEANFLISHSETMPLKGLSCKKAAAQRARAGKLENKSMPSTPVMASSDDTTLLKQTTCPSTKIVLWFDQSSSRVIVRSVSVAVFFYQLVFCFVYTERSSHSDFTFLEPPCRREGGINFKKKIAKKYQDLIEIFDRLWKKDGSFELQLGDWLNINNSTRA